MASSGVNVKMGVTGISQFKQNISAAQNSLKTLNAQLTLNEKQFKATGDAETYLQQKSDLLKVKLDEQKAIAEQAEKALQQMTANGVDKASKSFQDMQQQLLKAKADMLDTQTELGNIGQVADDTDASVMQMNANLQEIGKGISYQNVTDGISSITSGLEKAALAAWKTGEAIVKATLGAGSWADELKTAASRYGISTDELQQWRKTSTLIDTTVEDIVGARKQLEKSMMSDSTEKQDIFTLMGLDIKDDATGEMMDTMDVFWKAGEFLMKMGDGAERNTVAMKLFGKSYDALMPLFEAGRKEWEETNASWSIVSEESIDNLGKMDDQYQKLTSEFETFKMELLSAFSGPLTEGMKTITGLFQELNEYLQTEEGQAMLTALGTTITSLITDLTEIEPEKVVAGLQEVINGITSSLQWINDHSGDVVTAMEVIFAGWGLLKLTGGALKILEVVDGLKWLKKNPEIPIPGTGGGAGTTPTTGGGSFLQKIGTGLAAGKDLLLPAGALVAGGYVGAKMIEANLNDENLNQVYGDQEGQDLLDRMTEKEWALTKLYEDLYENQPGSEEAMDARDALQQALQELGITNDEQGVGLIENIFEEKLREMDLDGMVEKYDRLAGEMLGGNNGSSNSEFTTAVRSLTGMPLDIALAVQKALSGFVVTMDGQTVGGIVAPYVDSAWGDIVAEISK